MSRPQDYALARDDPQIYGLILEYVDGVTLQSIVDGVTLGSLKYPRLDYVPHSLLEIAYAMGSHGVIHGDIRLGNILVTPTQAVLIDFGHATIRSDNMSDTTWDDEVEKEDDLGAVQQFLHRHRVRDISPFLPEDADGDIAGFNDNMMYEEERWRNRWYDQVAPDPNSENRPRTEGEDMVQQWALKPEVKVWRDTRSPAPERWRIPRPGSPGFSPS